MLNSDQSSYIKVAFFSVVVLCLIYFAYLYNNIVKKEELVKESWSQVESNLQRKFDLLPNLVKVVKSYAKHEKEIFTKITALRGNANKLLSKEVIDTKTAQKLQSKVNGSFMQLFAVAENYPDLKSSEIFLELQAQIEGSENRINITRMLFNEAVGEFNGYIRQIPVRFVAGICGFSKQEYFKADDTSKKKFNMEI